jgi:hypothetical protein
MPGGRYVYSDQIAKYFLDRPGLDLMINDVAAELGLQVAQVQKSINWMTGRVKNPLPILTIVAGRIYRYSPGGETKRTPTPTPVVSFRPSKPLYEFLGTTKDGSVLVQDETGKHIYRLVEL